MNRVNPEMIVLARELKGCSQVELADGAGIGQSSVSRYESGIIEPPEEHLAAIASFLERPVDFFYWDTELYSASCMYHRKNRRLSVGELRMIHAKVNLLRIQAFRLLASANIKSKYAFHRLDASKYGSPEECARKLRQLWQLPMGPARNVVRSIEAAGGMVFRCPFGVARVDGISQWVNDNTMTPPVFFVHEDIPGDRQRLTLAHEIGHVVMHHMPTDNDPESEANRFAAEFLMPAEEIRDELHNLTLAKAAALKTHWKTSIQSIIVRAHEIGTIDKGQYQYMFRQLSMKGYRLREPVIIPNEEPEMFNDLIRFHGNSLGYNSKKMASLLGENESSYLDKYGHNFSRFKLVG